MNLKNEKHRKTINVYLGCVLDEKSRILITNRCEKKLQEVDGKWELPGGKIEFGETIEQCIEREVHEETGYEVECQKILPVSQINLWNYETHDQHTIIIACLCKLKNNNQKEVNDHAINSCKWIKYEERANYDYLPGILKFINSAYENK